MENSIADISIQIPIVYSKILSCENKHGSKMELRLTVIKKHASNGKAVDLKLFDRVSCGAHKLRIFSACVGVRSMGLHQLQHFKENGKFQNKRFTLAASWQWRMHFVKYQNNNQSLEIEKDEGLGSFVSRSTILLYRSCVWVCVCVFERIYCNTHSRISIFYLWFLSFSFGYTSRKIETFSFQ